MIDHYEKLQPNQLIRINDDHAFTCIYQGNKTFINNDTGKIYLSLRQFMMDNHNGRQKTQLPGDAWKVCEKQLPDGIWVKCKRDIGVKSVEKPLQKQELELKPTIVQKHEPANDVKIITNNDFDEEQQLLLLNESLQKQIETNNARIREIQAAREINEIDIQIQALQQRRNVLLTNVSAADKQKEIIKPFVNRVLNNLIVTNNNNELSKFLAPVAELYVSDDLQKTISAMELQNYTVTSATDVDGLCASHDLEIKKADGTIIKVQVKGRADKNWGINTGKIHYCKTDFDLLAYLHYEKMGDLSSAKLYYFPASALFLNDSTTMCSKVPAAALKKYCNPDAQTALLREFLI